MAHNKRKSAGIGSTQASRRTLLAGGLGASLLVALPDVLLPTPAFAGAAKAGASGATTTAASGHFFLYGTTEPGASASVQGWQPRSGKGKPAQPRTMGTDIAARPVRSPDGRTVAFPTVRTGAVRADVTLTLIDTQTSAIESSSTLPLPGVPADASVLVRPVFAGATTVAVVIAVSVPSNWQPFRKESANGLVAQGRTATWTTHHQLAYLDRATATFTGPFHLHNAPALAWTDTVADESHLYMWTMMEPAASGSSKAAPFIPLVQMHVFPLGAASPSHTMRSPGGWPNGHTGLVLATGHIVRLVDGVDLEIFSPSQGTLIRKEVTELKAQTAKPGATTLHPRPDGTLVLANAAVARAVVLDAASAFRTVSEVRYQRPAIALGGPSGKTALSVDGEVLYTLGPADGGGLCAYHLGTGALISTFSDGSQYAGVYQLPSGTLLAVDGQVPSPRLSYFSSTLSSLGVDSTSMFVAEVL